MKKISIFLLVIFFIVPSVIPVAAEEEEYEYTPLDKLTRGIFNVATAPLELPVTVYKTSTEKNLLLGLLYGIPLGIGKGFIRLCVGIVEIFIFPSPPFEPTVEPEFLLFKRQKIN